MPSVTNVTRRSGSGNWYFRRTWPKDLQPLVGKREEWVSLRTADLREARARAAEANWRFEQRINELRRRCSPDEDDLRRVVRLFYDRELAIDHRERIRFFASDDDCREFSRMSREELFGELKRHLADGKTLLVEWAADEIIMREGWLLERGSYPYLQLSHQLQRAWLEALQRAKERDEGDFDGEPRYELLKTAEGARGASKAKPGETIMAVFERFAKEQKRQNSDTVDQSRKIVRRFDEFVGPGAHVSKVTPENARDWKFALQLWPIKANEIREFKDKSFPQIVEINRVVRKPVINEPTVAKYLSTLGSFGKWLKAHRYIKHHPTEGLLPERNRHAKKRLPFATDQLVSLFASPLFTGCAGDRREHELGDLFIRDDRYWLFPVALFSGARLGELCQLRVDDLLEEQGLRFARITNEGEGMRVKSASSVRDVPLHPELLRLGFPDYVEKRRAAGGKQVFPRWSRNVRGHYGESSKWLNAYLERSKVKTDRLRSFHSLRHNFVDALRNAGYHEAEFKPLLGHSDMTVTRGYGTAPDVALPKRAEMVAAVSYPGLDLSDLYPR